MTVICLVKIGVKDDIARAQRFEDKSSLRSIPVNEAELRADSQNFADTAELLKQLLKKLEQLRFIRLQTGLVSLVRSAAIDQLQAVNALLNREQLYEPAVGFAAWDGGPGLNLLAFAVPDQGALGAYLISQRERVATLANQYARPPLNYLVQSNQPAGPLMLRWRQLITDLDDYYSNRPDNPIADLENFILGELGTITAAGCSSRIAAAADRNQGDFFVLRRLELQRSVLSRCDKVAAVRVNSAYRTLAAAFNNQLAGRFSFVTTAVANTLYRLPSGDAEPSVIRALFSLSEQLPDNVKAAMGSGDTGSARLSSSALAFLNALAATRPVLAPWLDAKPGDAVPGLGFSIEFRVNRADKIGGDQIIEWTLETGARRIHPTDKDLGGRWQFGEPVRLRLRWATGSPWRPTTNRARPDLQVKDDTATFVYPDGWALFKLIDLNRLYPGRRLAGRRWYADADGSRTTGGAGDRECPAQRSPGIYPLAAAGTAEPPGSGSNPGVSRFPGLCPFVLTNGRYRSHDHVRQPRLPPADLEVDSGRKGAIIRPFLPRGGEGAWQK